MSEASSAFAPLAFMSAAEEYRACAAMCFDLAENQPEQQDPRPSLGMLYRTAGKPKRSRTSHSTPLGGDYDAEPSASNSPPRRPSGPHQHAHALQSKVPYGRAGRTRSGGAELRDLAGREEVKERANPSRKPAPSQICGRIARRAIPGVSADLRSAWRFQTRCIAVHT